MCPAFHSLFQRAQKYSHFQHLRGIPAVGGELADHISWVQDHASEGGLVVEVGRMNHLHEHAYVLVWVRQAGEVGVVGCWV